MPDPSAPPQPHKPKRFWLFAPYVLLLIAILGWSGFWWVEKLRVEHSLNSEAKALQAQGYPIRWQGLSVGGWPFRLRVAVAQPEIGDSAGWRIKAPRLLAQAMAYAPDLWVIDAPDEINLTLTRPGKGGLIVTGKSVRASLAALGSAQPRFVFEGDGLTLSPALGAQPAPFSTIGKLELYLKPGPDDQAAMLVRIEDGDLRPEAGLAKLAFGMPFALTWDARLTKRSALRGSNWPGALQSWRNAGGQMTVANVEIGIGGLMLKGAGGPVTVDTDGRLSGQVALALDAAGQNQALLKALGLLGPVPLSFKAGRASIGPIPVGAALKIG